jgi:hypothetical protein
MVMFANEVLDILDSREKTGRACPSRADVAAHRDDAYTDIVVPVSAAS